MPPRRQRNQPTNDNIRHDLDKRPRYDDRTQPGEIPEKADEVQEQVVRRHREEY